MDESAACSNAEAVRIDLGHVFFLDILIFINFGLVGGAPQLAKWSVPRIDVDFVVFRFHKPSKLHTHLPKSNVTLLPLNFTARTSNVVGEILASHWLPALYAYSIHVYTNSFFNVYSIHLMEKDGSCNWVNQW